MVWVLQLNCSGNLFYACVCCLEDLAFSCKWQSFIQHFFFLLFLSDVYTFVYCRCYCLHHTSCSEWKKYILFMALCMFSCMPRGIYMTLSIACLLLGNICICRLPVYMFWCLFPVICRAQLILDIWGRYSVADSGCLKNKKGTNCMRWGTSAEVFKHVG